MVVIVCLWDGVLVIMVELRAVVEWTIVCYKLFKVVVFVDEIVCSLLGKVDYWWVRWLAEHFVEVVDLG